VSYLFTILFIIHVFNKHHSLEIFVISSAPSLMDNFAHEFTLSVLLPVAFNVGEYRRAATKLTCHDFFRPDNPEAENLRT